MAPCWRFPSSAGARRRSAPAHAGQGLGRGGLCASRRCRRALLRAIEAARDAIYVQSYAFTSRQLASALVAASRRGVRVAVLADADEPAAKGKRAVQAGGRRHPGGARNRYAAAHNKVMVIDPHGARPAVVTGSYNFTWSAAHRNAETCSSCATIRCWPRPISPTGSTTASARRRSTASSNRWQSEFPQHAEASPGWARAEGSSARRAEVKICRMLIGR